MSTQKLSFKASAENFAKIPGAPVAYWVSEAFLNTFMYEKISDISGMIPVLRTKNAMSVRKISIQLTGVP